MKTIKLILTITIIAMLSALSVNAQLKIKSDGKIGIGSISDPQSALEIEDQKWMMFNAHDNSSGILFHETQGKTQNTVQYGGSVRYEENIDCLVLGSFQNWAAKNAIYISRGYGTVGIAGSPDNYYKLKVWGYALAEGSWVTSDKRFKEDIKDLSNEPCKLSDLRGVSYVKKSIIGQEEIDLAAYDTITDKMTPVLPEREYGFIAQEVKEIFPNLVLEDENGYLAVNYDGFIPLVVETIKEQQTQITTLQQIVTEHEKEILALKEQQASELNQKSAVSVDDDISTTDEGIVLYQNAPNPFNQETEIKFYIPQEITNAKLYIHDLNGGEIKVYTLSERENGSLVINGAELSKGMYTYTLVADNAIIDTKRMILTE